MNPDQIKKLVLERYNAKRLAEGQPYTQRMSRHIEALIEVLCELLNPTTDDDK